MNNIYNEALQTARIELEELQREQEALESRLDEIRSRVQRLSNTVETLASLVEFSNDDPPGLTQAISELLTADSSKGYNPVGVREGLRKRNFPIDEYSNPLAVIHTTLKRLLEQEKIRSWAKDGQTYFSWVPTPDDEDVLGAGITDNDIPF